MTTTEMDARIETLNKEILAIGAGNILACVGVGLLIRRIIKPKQSAVRKHIGLFVSNTVARTISLTVKDELIKSRQERIKELEAERDERLRESVSQMRRVQRG